MKLTEFATANRRYEAPAIAADEELSQDVQTILINLGLLRRIEAPFGQIASGALSRFQAEHHCKEPNFLGPATASKLLEVDASGSRSAAPVITIEALRDTVVKKRPLVSDVLLTSDTSPLPAGTILDVVYFESERNHFKVTLNQEYQGSALWFVLCEDVKMIGGENLPQAAQPADEKPDIPATDPQNTIKLNVPYKSQRDNYHNPDGSCNVTSIAMCLEFLSVASRSSSIQFEDELYEYALNNGLSRHSPYDLAKIANDYGVKDAFDSHATLDAVKGWLAAGNPIVTHGYFTSFGHIIVLVGYDDKGFIVHDPYGEWYAEGYDRNDPNGNDEKGKFLHYSYGLIERTCMTGGEFWIHFISK
ncbi:C39 family peptidase [filamentous cyanobacterium LEGE 11480]|uniref:C39 family peptidase n=1 Tax=Romeriopsis navalis LEGE 11480 TaxID=2777977 RepID=A0A928Z6T0_9CYAN|nr:C39 family peptidase [Romeriopsis navalis]MBE9032958.1 C39 family peptidase [Romeriopsis navalis LEGE 11480]